MGLRTQAAFFTAGTVGRDGFRNDHQDCAAVALPVDRAPALIQSRSVFISEAVRAGLDHACGGVCACSTCHVIVREGLESCNEATDAELDELDEAPGITPKSRLGCQTVPDGTTDIVVEIPEWNKNYAKEMDH